MTFLIEIIINYFSVGKEIWLWELI